MSVVLCRWMGCLVGWLAAVSLASASTMTLTASHDTYINDNNFLGGPNHNAGSSIHLFASPFYSAPNNNLDALTLVQFDTSSLAGQTVVDAAALRLYLVRPTTSTHWFSDPRRLRVGVVASSWDESTVTHNNFGGQVFYGPEQSVRLASASDLNQYVDLTVPASVVQGWIDDPSSNKGLIVQSNFARSSFFFDLGFASNEHSSGNGPLLTFDVGSPGLAGDYNDDGVVDAADYTIWRDNVGGPSGTLPNDIDGGTIRTQHYETWAINYGRSTASQRTNSVPELSSLVLGLLAGGFGGVSGLRGGPSRSWD